MTSHDDTDPQATGYRNPPVHSRFRKGQSGNPRGRPKGRHRDLPYEAVLGQKVTIREGGVERRVTAAEAFLLHVTRRGLEGDSTAARAALAALETARENGLGAETTPEVIRIRFIVLLGAVGFELEDLRMTRSLDRYRDTARVVIEPWLVQAALDRLGDRRLTVVEQQIVRQSTRTPWKVKWPEWSEVT